MRQPKTPERIAYSDAKQRCTNPNHRQWKDYGGRGIKFLFISFEQFIAEIGLRPKGLTLDRADNNGNYEPGNVRWATRSQQNASRRNIPTLPPDEKARRHTQSAMRWQREHRERKRELDREYYKRQMTKNALKIAESGNNLPSLA